MANNSQQPSVMQFRPVIQAQQGQQFVPMTSQQFGHAGHAAPPPNVGMPVVQGHQLQYSQPMQQSTPIPIQPSHPFFSSLQAATVTSVKPAGVQSSSTTSTDTAILHDVIDIGDDDNSDDLVIIGEKVSKSNKGKRMEAIHQVVAILHDVIDIGDDDDSDDLVIIGEKISKSNKGKTIEAIHQVVAAPSKKKSAASLRSGRGLNLSLGVKSSNSERLLKSFRSKMKSASLVGNPEARKLLHASKPPTAPKFKSAKKAGGSSSSYHANFKDEILRKFGSFKQFDIVSDTSDHFFIRDIYGFPLNVIPEQRSKNWAKKIQKEWKILEKNLPDSIFVRIFESRMDLMRAVIIGVEGTPYHDGLFFFDIYLPGGFPNVPPHIYFHHRCGSSKLNPNLKPYGHVCLSILNTWDGNKNERWLPRVSTILQVLVSIQGLVLNTKPFFNQPTGFVSGTEQGESRSRCYNEEVCINSLWAMIHMIRRPPKNFEDFVVEHFLIRAHDILGACKAYMEGAQVGSLVKVGVQDVDEGDKSCTEQFKISLREPMEELVREFARIGAKDCEKFLCYKRTFSMKTQI